MDQMFMDMTNAINDPMDRMFIGIILTLVINHPVRFEC